jgi:hypothetical protein
MYIYVLCTCYKVQVNWLVLDNMYGYRIVLTVYTVYWQVLDSLYCIVNFTGQCVLYISCSWTVHTVYRIVQDSMYSIGWCAVPRCTVYTVYWLVLDSTYAEALKC